MRISTSMFHERSVAGLMDAQSRVSKTDMQISSGHRLTNLADDPSGASKIEVLRQAVASTTQYNSNAKSAKDRLSLEESSLSQVENVMQRVRELAIQSNNPTIRSSDRRAIAEEVRQNLDAMMSLANTKDGNGEYLFSGYRSQTRPFSSSTDGNVHYLGDQNQRFLQVGETEQMATGDTGWDVFMAIPSVYAKTAADTKNVGNGTITSDTMKDTAIGLKDNYQLTISARYEVRDASGTLVGNGDYQSGNPIEFMGVQTNITGQPAAEDGFTVKLGVDQADLITGPTSNNIGSGEIGDATVVDSATWQPGIYKINIIPQYEVRNSSGNVVAKNNYQSDEPIEFDNAQISIAGQPAVGDTFTIKPNTHQDAFSTLSQFADILENATGSDAGKSIADAAAHFLQDIDQASGRISDTRSAVGIRLSRLDGVQSANEDFSLQLQSTLSNLQDLDYTSAVSDLNKQLLTLQAAQSTYTRIANLSLFNSIR